jgi:hypothetical protein
LDEAFSPFDTRQQTQTQSQPYSYNHAQQPSNYIIIIDRQFVSIKKDKLQEVMATASAPQGSALKRE